VRLQLARKELRRRQEEAVDPETVERAIEELLEIYVAMDERLRSGRGPAAG
jgi:hypothetical protein